MHFKLEELFTDKELRAEVNARLANLYPVPKRGASSKIWAVCEQHWELAGGPPDRESIKLIQFDVYEECQQLGLNLNTIEAQFGRFVNHKARMKK